MDDDITLLTEHLAILLSRRPRATTQLQKEKQEERWFSNPSATARQTKWARKLTADRLLTGSFVLLAVGRVRSDGEIDSQGRQQRLCFRTKSCQKLG
jgi:hypothetical protein